MCRKRYSDRNGFLKHFNPAMQQEYCRDIRRIYTAWSPSLRTVADTYGSDTAETWLEIQLNDLAEFSGAAGKLDAEQLEALARNILATSPDMGVVQFMHFIQKFKAGEYGKFYGSVDALAISEALRAYRTYRRNVLAALQRQDETRRREAEWEENNRNFREFVAILDSCGESIRDWVAETGHLYNAGLTREEIESRMKALLEQKKRREAWR